MKLPLSEAVLASELILLSGVRVTSWSVRTDCVAISTAKGQLFFDLGPIIVSREGLAKVNDLKGHGHMLQFFATVNPLTRQHVAA